MVNCKRIHASWVRELVKPFQGNAPFIFSLETENLHRHVYYRKLIIQGNYPRGYEACWKKFPFLLKNISEIKICLVVKFTNLM